MNNDEIREELIEMVMNTVEELENFNGQEIIDTCLSIDKHMFDSQGVYQGSEVLITFGGPNMWINTEEERVYANWGSVKIDRAYNDNHDFWELVKEYASCMEFTF